MYLYICEGAFWLSFCVCVSGSSTGPVQLHGSLNSTGPPVKNTPINAIVFTWLIFHRPRAGQTGWLRSGMAKEWMVNKQASQCVLEEVGSQVARRHAWFGAPALITCQQWHFWTMAFTQAGIPATVQCDEGMKSGTLGRFYNSHGQRGRKCTHL